jgi:hypothetical protein
MPLRTSTFASPRLPPTLFTARLVKPLFKREGISPLEQLFTHRFVCCNTRITRVSWQSNLPARMAPKTKQTTLRSFFRQPHGETHHQSDSFTPSSSKHVPELSAEKSKKRKRESLRTIESELGQERLVGSWQSTGVSKRSVLECVLSKYSKPYFTFHSIPKAFGDHHFDSIAWSCRSSSSRKGQSPQLETSK